MKVIFLDNDGVICLSAQWGSRIKKRQKWQKHNRIDATDEEMPVDCRFDHFDAKAIKVLNKIIEETGAELVVSSDWRLYANLTELQEYYTAYGISKPPISVTKQMKDFDSDLFALASWKGWSGQIRADEIHLWLKEHPEVTSWVAVDDIDMGRKPEQRGDSEWGLENFVLTPRAYEGIKQSGIKEKIIAILNAK